MNNVLLIIILSFISIKAVSLESDESECKVINNNLCTYRALECGCPTDRPVTLINYLVKETSLIAHEKLLNSEANCLITNENVFDANFSKTTKQDCGYEGCSLLYEVNPKPKTTSNRSVLFKGSCGSKITPKKLKNENPNLNKKILELINIGELKSRLVEVMKDTYTRLQFLMIPRGSNANLEKEAHISFSEFSKIKLDSKSLQRDEFFMTGKHVLGDRVSIESYDFKNGELLHAVEINLVDKLPGFDEFESKVATYLLYQKTDNEIYRLLENKNFTRWFFKRHQNKNETDITSRNSEWPFMPFSYNGEIYFMGYNLGLEWESHTLYKIIDNKATAVSFN
jgi:hypothetical protein